MNKTTINAPKHTTLNKLTVLENTMAYSFRNLFMCILLLLVGARLVTGEVAEPEHEALPLDELRTFTEIFAKIKSDYVEQVDDKELLENAVKGMLEGLDPHSTYLDGESYKDLREGTAGEFGGLGIEVGMENGFVKVIAPIDDTPAQKAGVQAGDLIIKLDDMQVKGMSLNDAVEVMRGKPGVPITLTIIRENEEKPLTLTIVRDVIKVKSVRQETLEPGFGYVRISSFQAHTVEGLRRTIDDLKKDNEGKLKGVILDLRNNPGGILNAAVGVTDAFINKGLIVYTEGRIKDSKLKFNAKPNAKLPDVPMVVLVNAGSASASEIVAGALQDHGRAVIMGEKTFGKGSVQTVLPMNNNAALKLTTARYFTPNGRSIQASGVVPDIIIEKVKVSSIEDDFDHNVKESDLAGHLDNGTENKTSDESTSDDVTNAEQGNGEDGENQDAETLPLSSRDYELYEALNVLKGLAILKK